MKDDLKVVGANIRSWRKRAHLTLNQLSELAGLDLSFLNYVELGQKSPSLSTLSRLAKALGVSLGELFNGTLKSGNDSDYQLVQQVRALFKGKSAAEKAELVSTLKALRDPKTARAIRQLVR